MPRHGVTTDPISKRDANLVPGARHRATHQSSVDAILSPMGVHRRVVSLGSDFVNIDNWYIRSFAVKFCKWCKDNSASLTEAKFLSDRKEIVKQSNVVKVTDPYICIAETPDELPMNVVTALMGSAYHEAWHTKYSSRTPVKEEEVSSVVLGKSEASSRVIRILGANWAALEEHLLMWMNLVEDIRIERIGTSDFIGTVGRMEDIQDFVLDREFELAANQGMDSSSVICGTFRDLGKGYNTEKTRKALKLYTDSDAAAASLVMTGPLRKHLDRAMKLTRSDPIACFQVAMDIIIELNTLASDPEKCKEAANTMNKAENSNTQEGSSNSSNDESQEGNQDSESSSSPTDSSKNDSKSSSKKKVSAEEVNKAAKKALDSNSGASFKDGSKALKEFLESLGRKNSIDGRNIYRPLTTSFDKIVKISSGNSLNIPKLVSEVRSETSYLRTRLRHLFRATELVDVEHGLRKGKNISNRMIAESVSLIRSGLPPERAFYDSSEAPDLSMAAVIVMDESSSMRPILSDSAKVLLALSESLDSIGCKTAIVGFMKTDPSELYTAITAKETSGSHISFDSYHRTHAMTYHIFKTFDERFQYARPRFSALTGSGDTPMGDGLNFGINMLSPRNEGHRFIFVVTDGEPDDYGPVKNRLALAKTLGMKVIGIGLGPYSQYVNKCYPDHVWSSDISTMPPLLVEKITSIIERNERNRGKRVSKEDSRM